MLERGAVAGLNHLLRQQPWAAERLRAFAGQGVEFRCPPFPDLRLRIAHTGFLVAAEEGAASALVVKLKPAALPLLLAHDQAVRSHIEVQGPADLASAVDHLLRNLVWDVEEDLSTVFGDVLAYRLASAGKAFAAWQREAALRFAENAVEYWTEEEPLLARPADVGKFSREVGALRDEVARMEERVERLERTRQR